MRQVEEYSAPTVTVLGSVSELTQGNVYKTTGGTDVIYVNGVETVIIPNASSS